MKRLIYFALSIMAFAVILSLNASAATAGKVTTSGGNLNLRKSPSLSAEVITTAKNGSWFTIEESKGQWYKVSYGKGKTAYASADYVKNYPNSLEAEVKITSGMLNVRRGPGLDYEVKNTIGKGERVIVVKSNSDWAGIVYQGSKTGYVSKKYLRKLTAENTYPSVKLSVPSFKQYDSRWKSIPIGTTGGTIGSIGCLTTAIAMVESHSASKSITPPEMVKKLSYSASGSLYWPTDYVRSTISSSYKQEIYSLLKSGNPIIVGARKSNGGQHWVLVYGYEGGERLDDGKFLIHDPGSESRTTLESFFGDYPVKDRFVYKK